MIVAFDTSMLILLFDEKARGPKDPKTGLPVQDCKLRLEYLIASLDKKKGGRIIIPTPTLAEMFVRATPEASASYLSILERLRGIRISPFSIRAAIDFAEIQRDILASEKMKAEEKARLAKPKFDHQIVAIAKVEGATVIYSDDERLGKFAKRAGIKAIGVADLPLPPEDAQGSLPLEPPEPAPSPEEP